MRSVRPRDASLRWKILLALTITSALTLTAAVIALVPPLQHRLREDRLHALRDSAGVEIAKLRLYEGGALQAGGTRPNRIALRLERRTGARAAIYDATGAVIADTDPDGTVPATAVQAQADDALLARADRNRIFITHGEAVVVRNVTVEGSRYSLILRKKLEDTTAAFDLVRRGIPLAAGVGLAVALLLGLLLSSRLVRRLERLRRDARRLRDEGIAEPLHVDAAHDEVGELGRALEAMRLRLVEDERARKAFLDTAAHELRTPIASLQGTLELLEEGLEADTPDLAGARERASSATALSRRMAQLTTDLLDLDRLDGELTLERAPVNLIELATSVASEFEHRAAGVGVDVRVLPATLGAWADADVRAVARILRVLLDNAVRYAAPGAITVSAGTGDTSAWLRVEDDGPGIAQADRERIFDRFARGAAGERNVGFGLGLAIGRELARHMDGDLVVLETVAGAALELTLPPAPPPL